MCPRSLDLDLDGECKEGELLRDISFPDSEPAGETPRFRTLPFWGWEKKETSSSTVVAAEVVELERENFSKLLSPVFVVWV